MKKVIHILFLFVATIFISCSDEENTNAPSGLIYSYCPTNIGHEVIYDVTLITKEGFSGAHDTDIYQVKQVIESEYQDNQGRPTQRLERYRRNTPNEPWVISDVWTTNRTPSRLEQMEENISYIKLAFPIKEYVTWNGNSLNSLDPQDYEYKNLHQADLVGGINFDSTLTVLQLEFSDQYDTLYQVEKYATGVGLIYKEEIDIQNLFPAPGIKSQRILKQTIVSWTE